MVKQVKIWLQNPIISGSLIMIIGTNLASVLNYFYHFVIGRLLGPANYGELATLISVLVLLSIIPSSSGLVIIKFIATSKDAKEIGGLIKFFQSIILFTGIAVLLFGFIFLRWINDFLKIEQPLLFALVIIGFLITNLAFVNKSVLQGLVRFKAFVWTGLFENSLKLVLGVVFVWMGWSVFGAMTGLILAYSGGWLVSWWLIKDYKDTDKFDISKYRSVIYFTFPVFVHSISTISLYTSDIILVKHFFSSYEAGIYAAVSSLAKIILFASGPVGAVMFPWIAKKQSRNEDYWQIFDMSMYLTILICVSLLGVYKFFPSLAIQSLFGSAYIAGSTFLFLIGFAISLLTLSMLIINFFLSVGKTWVVVLPSIAAIIQVVGINIWHGSLTEVLIVSIVINGTLLMALFSRLFIFRFRHK